MSAHRAEAPAVLAEVDWDSIEWVEVRCPNRACNRYVTTVPKGTPMSGGYCLGCKLRWGKRVAV